MLVKKLDKIDNKSGDRTYGVFYSNNYIFTSAIVDKQPSSVINLSK